MGNQCPKLGHSLPIVWALIALRSGTRVNSPMATITLGENILKLRVVSATFEVRRKLYENANPIAKKWVENLPHMPKWWYFSPKSWYIDDTFWEVYGKHHYDKLSDYQSVAKEVKRNDDTMILFSKKKLFVRKILRKTHVVICKESLESDGFCIGIAVVLLGSGFARTSLQDFF